MATLQHQVKINAPLEKVWNILVNLEEIAHYNPLVTSVKYISPNKTGVGSSRQCDFKPKGSGKERVTNVQEMKSISMEMYESDWPLKYMHWTNTLSVENGQTVVTTITSFKMKYGLLGGLMSAVVMKPKFNKVLDQLFAQMKDYVEKK